MYSVYRAQATREGSGRAMRTSRGSPKVPLKLASTGKKKKKQKQNMGQGKYLMLWVHPTSWREEDNGKFLANALA